MRHREASLLAVSGAVVAYQVVLVRAFSIGQWHHFAYMVISIALLGFGASGALLAAVQRRGSLRQSEFPGASTGLYRPGWFAASSTFFALALPVSFVLAQKIPFEPFLIIWDRMQLLYLGCYYLALFVPFFAAAGAIGLALMAVPEESPRLYFYNMAGSGAGAALAIGLLEVAPVERALLAIAGLAQGGAVLALLDAVMQQASSRRQRLAAAAGVAAMAAATLVYAAHPPMVRISQYKGLSYALNLPGAQRVAQRSSALGQVDAVASRLIRHAPGLSLATPPEAATPPQLGLFVDAETSGAINAFDGDTAKLTYLDWMTPAAPYFAGQTAKHDLRVCVLGAGGGAGVLLGLRHGAQQVDAVELDANLIALLRGPFREFAGALYDRPEVRVHHAEARAFLEGAHAAWDVIDLSLVDSFAAAAAGMGAVGENYTYTVEAFETYLRHLDRRGLLAVTRWVRLPPRDELKLFATAIAALERTGLRPGERLVLVRSWATATLLVRKEAFTADEIAALRGWADERLFDLAYFPGILSGEGNRFNVLERNHYAEAVPALLAGGARREQFFREYAFSVRPATDDRPYFFHFFRWRALPLMLGALGGAWIPFVDWGYLILLATLAQAALLGVVLIFLPLVILRRRGRPFPHPQREPSRWKVLAYFLALGLGYMGVELALIQRLVLVLANPVYAVAVVLAGLLLITGAGSGLASWRLRKGSSAARLARDAALLVAATTLVYALALPATLHTLLGWPLGARIGVALAVMLPLAAMGMPFPLGLRQLGKARAELLPWAWAVNGCASVVAGSLATLVALHGGPSAVLFAAAACYVLAALVGQGWK